MAPRSDIDLAPIVEGGDAFERARQRFMQGLASLQAQQFEEAEAHFTASLREVPGRTSTLVNLAATRLARERYAEALEAADVVIAIEPEQRDGWYHRANALVGLQRPADAAPAYARALAIDGDHGEIWLRQAQTLHTLDRRDEALAAYRRGLALQPQHGGAWARCGDLLREQHQLADAAHAFRQAIANGADDELTRYALAAVTQGEAPPRAPEAYVRRLFDGYAADFDQHLVGQLGYQAHEVLVRRLRSLAPGPFASALDLGCGTGLVGPLVRPAVQRLAGVDLSTAMLDKARALKVYDALVQADAVEHLAASAPGTHDLVLAADVLIYVGALEALFAALRQTLRPGGLFACTVELPRRPGATLELMPSLRYAHSEAYLRHLAAAHGFAVLDTLHEPLRRDQRVPIDGLYMTLRRG